MLGRMMARIMGSRGGNESLKAAKRQRGGEKMVLFLKDHRLYGGCLSGWWSDHATSAQQRLLRYPAASGPPYACELTERNGRMSRSGYTIYLRICPWRHTTRCGRVILFVSARWAPLGAVEVDEHPSLPTAPNFHTSQTEPKQSPTAQQRGGPSVAPFSHALPLQLKGGATRSMSRKPGVRGAGNTPSAAAAVPGSSRSADLNTQKRRPATPAAWRPGKLRAAPSRPFALFAPQSDRKSSGAMLPQVGSCYYTSGCRPRVHSNIFCWKTLQDPILLAKSPFFSLLTDIQRFPKSGRTIKATITSRASLPLPTPTARN
ncbi:hypothetical protein MRX96_002856 [Rhipicephalus microplus]